MDGPKRPGFLSADHFCQRLSYPVLHLHSHTSGNVRHGTDRHIRPCMGRNGRSIRPSTGPDLEHMAHAKTASYHHWNGCLLYRPLCRLPAGRIRLPEMFCCSRNIPPGKQPGPGRILPHKDPGKMGCPSFWYFSIVLGIPFLNRAYRNRPQTFTDYALLLTAVCLTVITFYCICSELHRRICQLTSGRYRKKHENVD